MKSTLQKFYDYSYRTAEMPTFDELTPEQVTKIKNSLNFAAWNADRAAKALKIAIIRSLPKRKKYHLSPSNS